MRMYEDIGKDEIRDLLGKGWLTHDGSWFVVTAYELGIEKANKLNRDAITSMAPLEARRLREILGINGPINSFDEIQQLLLQGMKIILPQSVFSKFHYSVVAQNTLHWEWESGECFAYKGMKRMGLLDNYRCGVIYRIECWFRALEIEYKSTTKIDRCLMHQTGYCGGNFEFFF